jgi:RimJ/RimL family protein N-acetyltransferase
MFDLSNVDKYEVKQIEGIKIEKGKIEELKQTIIAMKDFPWEFRCHLHDNVREFFVAKDLSGIQHISWIYSKDDHNRLLSLANTDIEIKHCYTSPTVRGKGIYPNVINTIKKVIKKNGIKRVFMSVHPDNTASIKGIERAGFHLVGKVRFVKFLGIKCSRRIDTSKIILNYRHL